MQNCVCKTLLLAIAFLLVAVGVVFAGDNAGVVTSLDSPAEVVAVGAGDTVKVTLSASGMVGVKQFDWTIQVDPPEAFDLAAATYSDPPDGFLGSDYAGVEVIDNTVRVGAAQLGGDGVSGDGTLGTINLVTAAGYTAETEATITVIRLSLGPSRDVRDVFDAAALELGIAVNPPAPPYTLGDVNNDGGINPADALMALNIFLKKIEFTETQALAADCDGIAGVTPSDALRILNVFLKKPGVVLVAPQ